MPHESNHMLPRKMRPPTRVHNLGRVIYFQLHLLKSGIHGEKIKRIVLLRELTSNWQHPMDPEAASVQERWARLEVG